MKTSKKEPENAANQQPSEKVHESPKTRNFWVNLNNIRTIQRKPDSDQYSVLFVGDPRVYTFNVNPLQMGLCYGKENWVGI